MKLDRFIRQSFTATQILSFLRCIGVLSLAALIWGVRALILRARDLPDSVSKLAFLLVGGSVMFIPAIAIALESRFLLTGQLERVESNSRWHRSWLSLAVCFASLMLAAFPAFAVQLLLFDYFELIPLFGSSLVFVLMLVVLLLLAYGGPAIQQTALLLVSREGTNATHHAGVTIPPRIDLRGMAYLLAIALTVYSGFCKSGQIEISGIWGEMSHISFEVLVSFLAIDTYKTQFIDRKDILVVRVLRLVFTHPVTYITILVLCSLMWHLYTSYLINPLVYRQDEVTNLPWTAYRSPVTIQYSCDLDGWKTVSVHDDTEARLIVRELKKLPQDAAEVADDDTLDHRVVVSITGADGALLLHMSGNALDQEFVVQELVKVIPSESLRSLLSKRLGLSAKYAP